MCLVQHDLECLCVWACVGWCVCVLVRVLGVCALCVWACVGWRVCVLVRVLVCVCVRTLGLILYLHAYRTVFFSNRYEQCTLIRWRSL